MCLGAPNGQYWRSLEAQFTNESYGSNVNPWYITMCKKSHILACFLANRISPGFHGAPPHRSCWSPSTWQGIILDHQCIYSTCPNEIQLKIVSRVLKNVDHKSFHGGLEIVKLQSLIHPNHHLMQTLQLCNRNPKMWNSLCSSLLQLCRHGQDTYVEIIVKWEMAVDMNDVEHTSNIKWIKRRTWELSLLFSEPRWMYS